MLQIPGKNSGLGEIADEKSRYTTKCFDWSDENRITLGYIGLTILVEVWAIVGRPALLG